MTDTGIGIRAEDQAVVFEEFRQVEGGKDSTQEGTGLGLYVSGRLASLIGAHIEFESHYGKGSRFTVLMPKA